MSRIYMRKHKTKYSLQNVHNGVKDILDKGKTYREAQNTHNVPMKVIYERIKGGQIDVERMGAGAKKALPQQVEEYLVLYLKRRMQMGDTCQKEELKLLIKEYVENKNLKTPFKNNKPGDDWYLNFTRKYPELSLNKPNHLQTVLKEVRKPNIVYECYDVLNNFVNENNLQEQPEFVFNCDESQFQRGLGCESTTVFACVSANGHVFPPLIVFKEAVQASWTFDSSYPGTLYAATKTGLIEEPVFFNWLMKSFIPYVNKLRMYLNEPYQKCLLIYGGRSSRISLRIIEEAEKANVLLLKFPNQLLDRIQPLDKFVLGPVKEAWNMKLVDYKISQVNKFRGSHAQFCQLFGEVYNLTMKPEDIRSGFSRSGLHPVDPFKFLDFFQSKDSEIHTDIVNNKALFENNHLNCDGYELRTEKGIVQSESEAFPQQEFYVKEGDDQSDSNNSESSRSETDWQYPTLSRTTNNINILHADSSNISPLINKVLTTISLDTETADHIKRKISSCFINAVTSVQGINSPSKHELEKLFGINKQKKKTDVPRLKQNTLKEWLHDDKRKNSMGREVQKIIQLKKGKEKTKRKFEIDEPISKKQRLDETNDITSSEDELKEYIEYGESDDSEFDTDKEYIEDFKEPKYLTIRET